MIIKKSVHFYFQSKKNQKIQASKHIRKPAFSGQSFAPKKNAGQTAIKKTRFFVKTGFFYL